MSRKVDMLEISLHTSSFHFRTSSPTLDFLEFFTKNSCVTCSPCHNTAWLWTLGSALHAAWMCFISVRQPLLLITVSLYCLPLSQKFIEINWFGRKFLSTWNIEQTLRGQWKSKYMQTHLLYIYIRVCRGKESIDLYVKGVFIRFGSHH